MGEKNPVESVLFYKKNDLGKAVSRENTETVSKLIEPVPPTNSCSCVL